jgi:pimeloyl-ACP methyl ester carboxylesterase
MPYVDAGGVATWYAEHGRPDGPPVVLLHGALSDASSFGATVPALVEAFRVLTPERRGHGHTADVDGPITYRAMAEDTVAFLEAVVPGPARLVGHSDGANVALLVALARPDLVERMVLISANYRPEGVERALSIAELAAEPFVVDAYAERSPDGRDHFPVVVAKIVRMIDEEPDLTEDDLRRVAVRTLVMVGDDDVIVPEHTLSLFRSVPDAELAVVPGTSHVLTLEKPAIVNALLVDFLTHDAVPTLLPVRRA